MNAGHRKTLTIPKAWAEVSVHVMPELISEVLHPYDGTEASLLAQGAAEEHHKNALESAVMAGELVTRNPLSKIEEPFALGAQLERSILLVDEFAEYVTQFGIDVDIAKEDPGERFTLEQAAQEIVDATGERYETILSDLETAVGNYDLTVHRPGELAKYVPITVRTFYEEAYWDDLNAWLEQSHPRIAWRFSAPASNPKAGEEQDQSESTASKTTQRTDWITRMAEDMFDDSLAIPEGGKSKLREKALQNAALFTESTFEKAWQAAKKNGAVEMANVEKYK